MPGGGGEGRRGGGSGEKDRYPGGLAAEQGEGVGAALGSVYGDTGTSCGPSGQGLLTPHSHLPQIKVEEDFGFEADEALDSSWVSRGPDKLLPYPTLASPPFDSLTPPQ